MARGQIPSTLVIGDMLSGVGTLTIAGGTVNVGCGIEVGYWRGGRSGALWLTGGQLSGDRFRAHPSVVGPAWDR